MLPALLALGIGCLINQDAFDKRREELTDHDGDDVVQEDDCDDADPAIFPGAAETCDGVDQDCDGDVDEGATDAPLWYVDGDADGHGDTSAAGIASCSAMPGTAATADDCDDGDPATRPDATDQPYDGVDQDCDGADLTDVDGDGHDGGDGDDCDDDDAAISPSVEETWGDDGVDNDCDGDAFDVIVWTTASATTRIDGDEAGGELGRVIEAWPEGDCIFVGAPYADGGVGSVFAIPGGTTPSLALAGVVSGSPDTRFFATSLAIGDGGALLASRVLDADGAGTVFLLDGEDLCAGSSGTETALASWTIDGDAPDTWLGSTVLWVDDLDGDGVQEVAVTAPGDAGGGAARGAIYIWQEAGRDETTTVASADFTIRGTEDNANLSSLSSAVDPSGSGRPYLVLGEQVWSEASAALFVIPGDALASGVASELATAGLVTWSTGQPMSAVNVGDVDLNGADNLIAGAWTYGLWDVADLSGFVDEAEAMSFITYETDGEWLTGVAPIGDFDLDGRADIGVLAQDWPAYAQRGQLGLLPGSRAFGGSFDLATANYFAQGSSAGEGFAYRVAPSGDFDHDGVADLAVTAPGASTVGTNAGAVYIVPAP